MVVGVALPSPCPSVYQGQSQKKTRVALVYGQGVALKFTRVALVST